MPLFQYFGWVGSFLLAALFAANWCVSAPIARAAGSDVPLDQKINIRIHTDHKWPERVVFDTTHWRLARDATVESEINLGSGETLAQAKRATFDALAKMPASPVRPCFPAPRSKGRSGRPRRLRKVRHPKIARG